MASRRDLEANLQQILQILQPDGPTPGQPPSHASQQTFVILILAQADANAARVLQEIMISLPQNRPGPPQPPPPGQSTPYTMLEDPNQGHPLSPSISPASSPSQVVHLGAPTDASPLCPVCQRRFGRRQERDRHMLTHLPLWLYCPFLGCPWRGDRSYTLPTHWTKTHADFGEAPKPEDCKIYNPVPLVQSVIRGELLIEEMTAIAVQAVRIRSQELEKVGTWEGEWGRRH